MTVTTSSSSYCSAAVFLKLYDARVIGDLVKDDGTRDASPSANANLAFALLAASGAVEAACLPAGRYTPTDLAALTGAGQALLQQAVAALAMQMLRSRRARPDDKPLPEYEQTQKLLEALRKGELCFGFTEVQTAGQLSAQADDYQARRTANGVVFQASPYFGSRTWVRR